VVVPGGVEAGAETGAQERAGGRRCKARWGGGQTAPGRGGDVPRQGGVFGRGEGGRGRSRGPSLAEPMAERAGLGGWEAVGERIRRAG